MRNSKNILLLWLLLFCIKSTAQNIIEIELDSIHCNENACYLLNISKDEIYDCDFITLTLAENRYNQVIDCSYSKTLDKIKLGINQLEIRKLTKLSEFNDWVANSNFQTEFNRYGKKYTEQFQAIDSNYGVLHQEKYNDKYNKWFENRSDVYQIIPILINSEYYIAGLIDIDGNGINHLIFPENKTKGLMYYDHRLYRSINTNIPIDSTVQREIFRSYIVRQVDSEKTITNTISSTPLIKGTYDKILIKYPFVILEKENSIQIYNEKLEEITPNKLRAVYQHFGKLQLIIDGEIKYLDNIGTVIDSIPKFDRVLGCGNVSCIEKRIYDKGNFEFQETSTDCYSIDMYESKNRNKNEYGFNINREIKEIRYLSDTTTKVFSVDCFMQFFCHDQNLYYFKSHNGSEGIFKRVNEKREMTERIWQDKSISYDKRREKIQLINDTLKVSYRDEILIEGTFEELILLGYNHPIIFKQNGLYGIYPQMKIGQYRSIMPFIGNLAEVEFRNGDKGWIDLDGNEIKGRVKDHNIE